MPSYTVRRAPATPEFIGNWDGPVWSAAETAQVASFHPKGSDHRPATAVKALYDDRGIYIHFRVEDRYVRCLGTRPMDPVYRDSCVEFFVQPTPGGGYLNVEANCGGAFLCLYIEDARKLPGGAFAKSRPLAPEWFGQIRAFHSLPSVVEPELPGPVTWQLEYFIPFALLESCAGPLGVAAGQTWRGNFYKCGDETSRPHWGAWSPIGEPLNFHQPGCFGEIVFAP